MDFSFTHREELHALKQLHFYISGNHPEVEEIDYSVSFTSVPFSMSEFMGITNVESIWAPIELYGLIKGLVSIYGKTISEKLGLDVRPDFEVKGSLHGIYLVKRTQYNEILRLMSAPVNNEYIYAEDLDKQFIVVNRLQEISKNLYKTQSAYLVESSLMSSCVYRIPADMIPGEAILQIMITSNYERTLKSRIIGKRSVNVSPDGSYFISVDSFDEAWQIATDNDLAERIATFGKLKGVSELDSFLMAAPIALGHEDIFLQGSYTRITQMIDAQYKKYRLYKLLALSQSKKEKLRIKVMEAKE